MKSLFTPLYEQRILSATAHPDDLEMQNLGILDAASAGFAYVASLGEASTVNHLQESLC